MTRPRILVTNDDGIFSEGIERLAAALSEVGDVYTVAPDQERSAAGHSLTLHHPLRAKLIGRARFGGSFLSPPILAGGHLIAEVSGPRRIVALQTAPLS